jgi:hypothetical protein
MDLEGEDRLVAAAKLVERDEEEGEEGEPVGGGEGLAGPEEDAGPEGEPLHRDDEPVEPPDDDDLVH